MVLEPRLGKTAQGVLDRILGNVIAVRILRYLSQAGGSHTGRAIARAVGISHTAVARALTRLAAENLVDPHPAGRAAIWTLNRTHWLAAGLRDLFHAEGTYRKQLGASLGKTTQPAPVSVILFGSMARGEMQNASDIDILCVIADATNSEQAEQRLHGATANLHRTFGRPVNILVWSKSAFADRYRAKDRLARNIVNSGEVIWGASLMEVLS